ncbi:DUF2752 domain-containing protein [Roseimicrobium sp. ORNL1]|uniref:DUF2752 domain-containing protein n=1 Tax=Roseimicrobium sp. ORNL1 TaxID=2711231 RepID=UPI0031B9B212
MSEAPPGSAVTESSIPERPSWGRRLWRGLTVPWFSSLLEQTAMCRAMLAMVALLGGAHLMGWSIWPCFFANMTGLPCPGCGMTRATAALLKGQWGLAMKHHPFSPGFMVMAAFLAWAALAPKAWRDPVNRWVKAFERRTCLPLLFLVCTFIYGLIRMAVPSTHPLIVSPPPVRTWLQERIVKGTE